MSRAEVEAVLDALAPVVHRKDVDSSWAFPLCGEFPTRSWWRTELVSDWEQVTCPRCRYVGGGGP